jgi:Protein of unknown function (DUF1553)/Protein of unknown function (DUF1549)/Planctomycete cytochrome C
VNPAVSINLSLIRLLVLASAFAWIECFDLHFALLGSAAVGSEPSRLNFNRDVRPILSENCFYCHGQDANKREADLRLDVRDAAVASGAINVANPSDSNLLHRVLETDSDTQMPPLKSNRKLTDAQKETLRRWLTEGAEYEPHWAFVTPARPEPPNVKNANWPRNPIDQFVLAKLEANGLQPSPEADRAVLIKRLYADLIGLPPTPEQLAAFVNSTDPKAYENLVDQLMQSQNYGERMALPWLDAARYADSNGFQQDGDTWQWMWRDWVVKALNDNLPFDQFTIWQLGGDLLPDATVEQKIASGFNRNHLLNGEGGAIAEEQRFVILFDRIDTTATTFLGLTMSCGQCHDHKYDPITQRDYYSLMDAFNRVPESGVPQYFSSRIRVGNPVLEVPTEEVIAKRDEYDKNISELEKTTNPLIDAAFHGWRVGLFADNKPAEGKGLPEAVTKLLAKEEKDRSDDDKKAIETELRKHFDAKVRETLGAQIPSITQLSSLRKQRGDFLNDQMPRPMIMSDAQPRDTHILTRGEYLKPAEKVSFATPTFLPPMQEQMPKNRLGFAQWLVSAEQPLTSRVQVNRMWQHFFGSGILKTAEDFGVQSEYPIHLDLLNWLAVEFRESGWDMKRLNRMIVTSSTYRQSSKLTEPLRNADPENKLYARASRMRMPAIILRDWALAACEQLDKRLGGKPVYPYQPDAIWESLAITKERDFTYPASTGQDLYRRSLYTFWRRTVGPANMFDASTRQTCKVRLSQTSTPLHALTTLNDPTWVEASRLLATRSMQTHAEVPEQLQIAFQRIVCRDAKADELARLTTAWEKQHAIFSSDTKAAGDFLSIGAAPRDMTLDAAKHAALTAVCLAIFNLDEALTRE